MKNVITIAIAITTLVAGVLLGKHFGNVKYVDRPVTVVEKQYVDTCLTQVKVNDKFLGVKKGVAVTTREDTAQIVTVVRIDTVAILAPVKKYEWEYKDSLVTIKEVALVRGEVLAFERTVTVDTPLVSAYVFKPTLAEVVATTAVNAILNPSFNPNFGKTKELSVVLGTMYNFSPVFDGMGGYTAGLNVRFDGGSSMGLTYNNIAKMHYAGLQLTLPILKFNK